MQHRVLVVDDEQSIVDNLSYALETEGLEVLTAGTAGEATRVLDADGIDLVVLDVGLPDVNGFDLCRDIRRQSDVPILFLTARSDEVDRIVGLELGADDYVVKPFSPREVSARVKAILRRTGRPPRRAESPPADSTNDESPLEVDDHRKVIRFCGQPLELSRYEYRLLAALMRRPGWVYSREQLMEAAWDEPETSTPRTVDTHIKTLRQKLREVCEAEVIRTHRGLGYSLVEQPPEDPS